MQFASDCHLQLRAQTGKFRPGESISVHTESILRRGYQSVPNLQQ
jgi:hypothetical protein